MNCDTVHAILYRESLSVGIQNTIARIRITYGEAYGIAIVSVPGSGTKVTIRLPL